MRKIASVLGWLFHAGFGDSGSLFLGCCFFPLFDYTIYIYTRLYTGHFPLPSVITSVCPLSITVQHTDRSMDWTFDKIEHVSANILRFLGSAVVGAKIETPNMTSIPTSSEESSSIPATKVSSGGFF